MHSFVQTHRQRQQTNATDAVAHERALTSQNHSERTRPTILHDFRRIPVCAKEPFSTNPAWKISAPGDFSEREADRVADHVMHMPEPAVRIGEEEELQMELCPDERARRRQMPEEKTVLARSEVNECDALAVNAVLASAINTLPGRGNPLPESVRRFMEPRFKADFTSVRVHNDALARDFARSVNAQAFTIGCDVVFGSGYYQPGTERGRHLLAHELTHVLQQGAGRRLLQRRPEAGRAERRRPAGFDLYSSEIGRRIRQGLESREATRPPYFAGGSRIRVVDPAAVLAILAASPLFIEDAREVNRLYFVDRVRTPELTFRFHLRPELGSEFQRAAAQVTVEVTALSDVVAAIVHETVHARHSAPATARATARIGEVTRVEQAGVLEEAQTRLRERHVMAEITRSAPWRTHTGQAPAAPVPRRLRDRDLVGEVRASFRSGWPKLTYQEGFIIEEMKRRCSAGIDTAGALATLGGMSELSHYIAVPAMPVRTGNQSAFRVNVGRYRAQRAASEPAPPPSLSEALACVRIFRGTPEWRTAFRRSGRLPADARVSAGCRALIEGWHDFIWRNEPYEEEARRDFFMRIIMEMRVEYERARAGREGSRLFLAWYNRVPEPYRANAREFFEWLLIERAISREWEALNQATPDAVLRGHHLDFLSERIGRPLAGISR